MNNDSRCDRSRPDKQSKAGIFLTVFQGKQISAAHVLSPTKHSVYNVSRIIEKRSPEAFQ